MIRQSVAANRTVYGSSTQASQSNNSLVLSRLLEKKKEIEAVSALEAASQLCISRLEALSKDFDVMADTGGGMRLKRVFSIVARLKIYNLVFGQVLEHWPRMFEILQLFLASRSSEDDSLADGNIEPEGQKLVRVLIEAVSEAAPGDVSS
jgi:hypothetical protein